MTAAGLAGVAGFALAAGFSGVVAGLAGLATLPEAWLLEDGDCCVCVEEVPATPPTFDCSGVALVLLPLVLDCAPACEPIAPLCAASPEAEPAALTPGVTEAEPLGQVSDMCFTPMTVKSLLVAAAAVGEALLLTEAEADELSLDCVPLICTWWPRWACKSLVLPRRLYVVPDWSVSV